MILSGQAIMEEVFSEGIKIDPFNIEQLNPNSYNYRIGDKIKYYDHTQDSFVEILIPQEGIILTPQKLYLANTYEIIGSEKYVTSLIGRSSVGRLGLFVQISADLGNLGSPHKWTLELTCVQRLIIYPYMKIGQVSFWVPTGNVSLYMGEYNKYNIPQEYIPSLLYNGAKV
jgi:dCTP deaminase